MTHTTMIPTRPPFNHIVAFEVAKAELVVHTLPADRQRRIPNTKAAVRRLLAGEFRRNRKDKPGPLLVLCEATGGYERHVLDEAHALGLACHRAHGARVRVFARYLGCAAKTDAIDARMLALYGLKTERLRLYAPPAPEERALKELKARRDDVQQMIIAETNRLEQAAHKSVVASIRAHIRALKTAFARLEKEIAALLRNTPALARKTNLMQSVTGVGPATAATLIAWMPELGDLSRGEAARLAGLAPIARDSGKSAPPRRIAPGRAAVRRTLYMAATIAMRFNPPLKSFAERLKARGKPFKVVVTAVMRKLIVILNAILRDGQPWKGAQKA